MRQTTEQIIAARKRADEAEAKAADKPGDLTDGDVKDLRPSTLKKLVHDGKLVHLGVGGNRRHRARG